MNLAGLLLAVAVQPAPAQAAKACVEVAGDLIRASDLVAAWPAVAALPGDTTFGYAPVPGAQRVFRTPELERLAKRNGFESGRAQAFCVTRPMETLTGEQVAAAVQGALADPGARVEVVDFSRYPVPRGTLVFPREGLSAAAGTPESANILWKGYMRYGNQRRFSLWARVRITVTLERVVAAQNLASGKAITADQVRIESYTGPPLRRKFAQKFDDVIGHVLRHSVPKGAPVPVDLLGEPADVRRGELVEVEVENGAAKLSLTARAESDGRQGQTVSVRNLQSGNTFAARVQAKGRVEVKSLRKTP